MRIQGVWAVLLMCLGWVVASQAEGALAASVTAPATAKPEQTKAESPQSDGAEPKVDESAAASPQGMQQAPAPAKSDSKILHHVGLRSFVLPSEAPARGKVVATMGQGTLQRAGDRIRLRFAEHHVPKVGERLVTFELGKPLHHPRSGKNLGRLAQISGSVSVEGVEGREVLARIDKVMLDLNEGQYALPVAMVLADAMDETSAQRPNNPAHQIDLFRDVAVHEPEKRVSGTVVAVEREALVAGNQRLVFIDRGSDDGLVLGDALRLLPSRRPGQRWVELLGDAVVVATQAHTATCLVLKSLWEVEAGDGFLTAVATTED